MGYLHAARDTVPGTWALPLTINTFTLYLDNGYIEGKELDDFFHHLLEKLGPEVSTVLLVVHQVQAKKLCWEMICVCCSLVADLLSNPEVKSFSLGNRVAFKQVQQVQSPEQFDQLFPTQQLLSG